MPFEILAGPAIICLIIGIFAGLKLMTKEDDDTF
ncbi:MAG: hypothetical protein JWR50_3627 [Mucilaginibacter sp.]|nr:hypothetical protein [Mucilaginibacter sp.]